MNRLFQGIKKLFKTGFFHIFGANVINKALAFLSNIILLHIISKAEYGIFTYAWNIYSIVILFNGLGIATGILQLSSEHSGDYEYSNRISNYGVRFGIKIDAILVSVLLGIGLFAPLKIESSRPLFLILCMLPIIQLLYDLTIIILRSQKRNSEFAKLQLLNTGVLYVVAIVCSFFFRELGLVIGHYVSCAVSTLVGMFLFRVKLVSEKNEPIGDDKSPLIKISTISMFNSGLSHLLYLLDVFILGIADPQETVLASYKAATLIPTALAFIPSALMIYIYPYFAQHRTDKEWCRYQYKKLLFFFGAFNMCVSAILVVFAPVIVKIGFGDKYLDCIPVFRILAINYFISATFRTISGNLLVTQRALKFNLFVAVFSSAVNAVADYFFIIWWGSIGAAIATVSVVVISSILSTSYLLYLFHKKQ
ncbi:MAG: oligosaccharide flippase family protein [Saccharofermentans sp.]|nr:oligosaccharide flippase family protein [Saccharofermentans sp.]